MSLNLGISWQHLKSVLLTSSLLSSSAEDRGKDFFPMACNVFAVWVESQLGDHYNAGDECCALLRGMSLFPLICFYKAADTIEDCQRMNLVLAIGATRFSFSYNKLNHLRLWLSTPGRGVRNTDVSARHHQQRCKELFSDSLALKCVLNESDRESDILYLQAISLASVMFLSKICSAFRRDYGEKRRAVYSPGSSEEQTQMT